MSNIGFAGCIGTAEILIRFKDDDGTERTVPATEWDLWRAKYISVEKVEEMLGESMPIDLEDFLAEGPEAPTTPEKEDPSAKFYADLLALVEASRDPAFSPFERRLADEAIAQRVKQQFSTPA